MGIAVFAVIGFVGNLYSAHHQLRGVDDAMNLVAASVDAGGDRRDLRQAPRSRRTEPTFGARTF